MEAYRVEAAGFLEKLERRDWKAAVDQFNAVDARAKTNARAFEHGKNAFAMGRTMLELSLNPSGARPPSTTGKALKTAAALRKKHNPRLDELGALLCEKNLGLLEEVLGRQESNERIHAPSLKEILAQIETNKNLIRAQDAENDGDANEYLFCSDEACDNSQVSQELETERALLQRHQNSVDSESAARLKSHARLVELRASLNRMGRCVEVVELRHDRLEVNIRTVVDANARSSPPLMQEYTHTLTVGLTGHSTTPVQASLVPQDFDVSWILQNKASNGKAVFSIVEQVVETLSYKMERKSALDGVARGCPVREIGARGTEFRVVLSNGVEVEIEIPQSWPWNSKAELRVLAAQHPSLRVEMDALIEEFNGKFLVRSGLREFLAGFAQMVSEDKA